MQPDGSYCFRKRPEGEAPFDAQAEFLADAQRRRKSHSKVIDRS
jgi:hypothetical protein